MKNIYKTCLLVGFLLMHCSGNSFAAQTPGYRQLNIDGVREELLVSASIDSLDTIYFDLAGLSMNSNLVEIPVYFKSDDAVFAMDFSFMYNGVMFSFDSITSVQSNFQYLFNYAPFDSTVYFTSYSLGSAYLNNSDVVNTRFNLLGALSSLSVQDIHHALGYLNGDACPVKIIPPSLTSLFTPESSALFVAPNPANSTVQLSVTNDGWLAITGLDGKIVSEEVYCAANSSTRFDVSNLPAGLYIVSFKSQNGGLFKTKLVVTR